MTSPEDLAADRALVIEYIQIALATAPNQLLMAEEMRALLLAMRRIMADTGPGSRRFTLEVIRAVNGRMRAEVKRFAAAPPPRTH